MRVRGLKPQMSCPVGVRAKVAPHAGAWIETLNGSLAAFGKLSHPMRVRGLKPLRAMTHTQ